MCVRLVAHSHLVIKQYTIKSRVGYYLFLDRGHKEHQFNYLHRRQNQEKSIGLLDF
jgi:hypothetical protein